MTRLDNLQQTLTAGFPDNSISLAYAELTMLVDSNAIVETCTRLRDEFQFEQLSDLAGIDYLGYGTDEWNTDTGEGGSFSRGVEPTTSGRFSFNDVSAPVVMDTPRFAVVYHLLSIRNNLRVRLKSFCKDNDFPMTTSVVDIWSSANWYEREAFDLFGIAFDGHPDLRRILTDYGFVGHAFRKDFPLIGHVEMRYDPETKRVVYEPVSIEPRVGVPKVNRADNRYQKPVDTAAEIEQAAQEAADAVETAATEDAAETAAETAAENSDD